MNRLLAMVFALIALVGATVGPLDVAAQSDPAATPPLSIEVDDGRLIGLSPDGTMYAFVIPATALCVFDAGTQQQLACAPLDGVDAGIALESVVWSPDSTRLAFAEDGFRLGSDGDLWVMDARSGNLTNLTDDGYQGPMFSVDDDLTGTTFFLDVAPAWTPDSEFVTFSRSPYVDGEPVGNDLAQVPAGGGSVETLLTLPGGEPGTVFMGTGWSPDGDRFYFTRTAIDRSDPNNGIWVYESGTGASRLLASTEDPELGELALAQVSPAGDRLLGWYPEAFGQFAPVGGVLLRLVDTDSGALSAPEVPTGDPELLPETALATFSPDGSALLLLIRRVGSVGELWVSDLATGEPALLLPPLEDAMVTIGRMPTWGANGNAMVAQGTSGAYLTTINGVGQAAIPTFTAAAEAAADATTMQPVGGEVRTVDLPRGRAVSMSPDGQLLAVAAPLDSLCLYDVATMTQVSCADLGGLNAGLRIQDVVWSPDSTRLAFAEEAFRLLKDGDLWLMDARTGDLTNLTDDDYDGSVMFPDDGADTTHYVDIAPAWTPDGRFVTFSRSTFIGRAQAGTSIAQVPATGGPVELLATVDAAETGVVPFGTGWAPNGEAFYFTVMHAELEHPDNGIWVYDRATGEIRLLARSDDPEQGFLALKAVSPAGDRLLAYYPVALMRFSNDGRSPLRFVDVATGAVSPVPDPASDSPIPLSDWVATFSPDGRWILLGTDLPDMRDFWAIDLRTGAATQVATDLVGATPVDFALGPVWGTNGVVFVAQFVTGAFFFPIEGAGLGSPAVSGPATAVASPATLAVGADVQTIGVAPLYAGPDPASPIAGFLPPNQVVRILAEPVVTGDVVWYPVFDPQTMIIGYVQGNLLQDIP